MDSDILKDLNLRRFSRLCRLFFDQMGFRAEKIAPNSGPEMSGVFLLYSKNSNKPFSVFQCTVITGDTAAEPLENFKVAMGRAEMPSGYFLTTGRFSQAAKDFAAANKVNLIDRDKFVELANNMPESSRNIFSEVMMAGEELEDGQKTSPRNCPKCSAKMALQISTDGKYKTGKYWQCTLPECGHITAFF